jgi:RNA polymerase I-specific transcription initiation factor RRN7
MECLKEVQGSLILQKWKPVNDGEGEEIRRPGELYKRYRRIEELPENARAFYELAGEIYLSIIRGRANFVQDRMLGSR